MYYEIRLVTENSDSVADYSYDFEEAMAIAARKIVESWTNHTELIAVKVEQYVDQRSAELDEKPYSVFLITDSLITGREI